MLPNQTDDLDPRVRRTRQSIVQAFKNLVDLEGFQAISVQDITEQAGINRATFYAHFPDKFALLQRTIEQDFRQEVEKRLLHACQFSNHNLRELIIVVCEFVGTTHQSCPASEEHYQSLVEAQVRMQIHKLLDKWLQELPTIANTPVPRERAATAASWAIYGLATEWSSSKRKPAVEQYADEVLSLVAANLGLTIELS
jgi:AcrR family transcriptional regulator